MGTKRSFQDSGSFSENAARPLSNLGFCLLLLCASFLTGVEAAHAQAARSALANIDLPAGARAWAGDEDGSKEATLDFAASLAGISCAAREAHAWPAPSGAVADDVATKTNTTLLAAKWILEPLSRTPDGQRILSAQRGNDRLVMVWQPGEGEVGLLICRAEGATADADPEPPSRQLPSPATRHRDRFRPKPRRRDQAASTTRSAGRRPPRRPDRHKPSKRKPSRRRRNRPRRRRSRLPQPKNQPAAVKEDPVPPPAVVEPIAEEAAAPAGDFGLAALVVAVLALVGGGVALILREWQARRRDTAWQWPTATTTIERGWIEEEEEVDRRGVPVTTYLPVLKYRYSVDGEDYEGSRIGLDDPPLPTADAARSRLAQYPDFTSVEIRYDPQDPAFGVIEAPRPKPGLDFYFGIGAIVIALALLLSHFF